MKKSIALPAVALVGGVLGLAVRRWYLLTGFEPGTGLPVSGVPARFVLWAVIVLTVAAAVLLGRGKYRGFEKQYTEAFRPRNGLAMSGRLAAAFFFVAGGFLNLAAYFGTYNEYGMRSLSILRPILGVVCLLAGAAIFLMSQKINKKEPVSSAMLLMPAFAGCLWVMANYQSWAKDPVAGQYAYSLLAVLLSMLACYFVVSFAFAKGKVLPTLVICAAASALCILSLGDGLALYDLALNLAFACYLLAQMASLAENAVPKQVPFIRSPIEGCAPSDCAACHLDCPSKEEEKPIAPDAQ